MLNHETAILLCRTLSQNLDIPDSSAALHNALQPQLHKRSRDGTL